MKRLVTFLVGLVFAVSLSGTIAAQQEPPEIQCQADQVSTAIDELLGLLGQAQADTENNDLQSALTALKAVQTRSSAILNECWGLVFHGSGSNVLGPIELEPGLYILEYASEVPGGQMLSAGMLSVDLENVDDDEFLFLGIMEIRQAAGPFEGAKSFRVEGGRYIIDVEQAMYLGDWTIAVRRP